MENCCTMSFSKRGYTQKEEQNFTFQIAIRMFIIINNNNIVRFLPFQKPLNMSSLID